MGRCATPLPATSPGSFSKVLFPALRLGYLVVPHEQVTAFEQDCRLAGGGHPVLEQAVVASFMLEGHFARHLRRMRSLYAARRAALAAALVEVFADRIRIELQAGGMHLLVRLPPHADDAALARRADAHGLAPVPLSLSTIEHDCGRGLLLGFTNIPEPDAPLWAKKLRQAIGGR
jgi:GntR family transcriptional regulator / MocR family aminotransferase